MLNTSQSVPSAGVSLHTGYPSSFTTTSTSTSQPVPTTPNVSNGGFLDFLIAVFAMILVLQSHKIVKAFLDHLFPGGGGHGPGALMSGLMEGVGMAAGGSIFRGGKNLAKTGAGMAGSATIGGLAAAHKYAKENGGAVGKDGILGGLKKRITPDFKQLNPPDTKALPPDQGARMNGPQGFTMGASGGTPGTGGDDTASGGFSMSFGPKASGSSDSSAEVSRTGLFDTHSKRSGAHTQLRPSAQNKLDELSQFKKEPVEGGIFGAFAQGAGERFKADAKHKLSGHKGYAGGARSLFGVANQEFGDKQDGTAEEKQMVRDSYLPSQNLMEALEKDPQDRMAMADFSRIGEHQAQMEEGVTWMEQGRTLQQALQPDYDQAEAQYDRTTQEVEGFAILLDGYKANGQTDTPEYRTMESQHQAAVERQTEAKTQFDLRESQMKHATGMQARGKQRVISAQNGIAKVNMGWMPENVRNAPRMVQAAQARANRKTLSDLGQAPHRRKELKRS